MAENLTSPLAHAVTLSLLHFVWQGLLVGVLYGLLTAKVSFRSAHTRYLASLVTLLIMAACPAVTFALLYRSSSDITNTSAVAGQSDVTPAGSAVVLHRTDVTPETQSGTQVLDLRPARGEAAVSLSLRTRQAIAVAQPYVLLLWLAGVLLSGMRLAGGVIHLAWLRTGRLPVSTEIARRAQRIAERLRLGPAVVFASERIRMAAAVGFFRPVVLLPMSWLTELPADTLEAVIAHELAHIRRWDLWVNLLQRLIETVLFYHPLVWWISNQVRLERELCCDELAVHATGSRGNYALALERVGRLRVSQPLRLATSFTGERNMNLLRRVEHVLGMTRKPDREPAWLVGLVSVSASLLLASLLGAFTTPGTLLAQDREGGRSAEAEAGPRRSAEAEAGPRRSAEAEAGPRRSAEADAGPKRRGEGDRAKAPAALRNFKPETPREEALYQMILELQQQMADMRREVRGRDVDPGEEPALPDSESSDEAAELPANWQRTKEGRIFLAYDKNSDGSVSLEEWLGMTNSLSESRREVGTQRYNAAEPSGDGKFTAAEFMNWYRQRNTKSAPERGTKTGPRDGEGAPKAGPKDGDAPRKPGPRDGEGKQTGPKDGDARKPGPRDGEGDKPAARDEETASAETIFSWYLGLHR